MSGSARDRPSASPAKRLASRNFGRAFEPRVHHRQRRRAHHRVSDGRGGDAGHRHALIAHSGAPRLAAAFRALDPSGSHQSFDAVTPTSMPSRKKAFHILRYPYAQ